MAKKRLNIHTLDRFLADFLETNRFQDYCPNGLQVEACDEIDKIALGVSASMALFRKAKAIKAGALLVHHGLFWNKMPYVLKGVHGRRVSFLFRSKISLFGFHLPLDHHAVVGNSASIGDLLGLKTRRRFAEHGGVEIGLLGKLSQPMTIEAIEKKLQKSLGSRNVVYGFGKKKIRSVGIVTGGAPDDVMEAKSRGADLYITGEVSEPTQEWCREAEMNFIGAGHYATEQFGIQNLGQAVTKRFGIPCQFIDIPNSF